MTTMAPVATVHRHPFLGLFGGLLLGFGIVLMLFVFGIVPVSAYWLGGAVLLGAVLGVVLAYVTPPRHKSMPA